MQTDPVHAFGALYANHHGWLRSLLRKKLGCQHKADDLAHDTFLKVLANRAAQVLEEPRAFLSTVAHGLVVSYWRRQDLERAYLAALEVQATDMAAPPEVRLQALEALVQIDELLDDLPVKARTAFLMSQLEERPYAEIAEALGVSERMVKKYMAQVMEALLRRDA